MGGSDALAQGQVLLNKYRIEQKLGEGGMALIYRASSIGAAGFERKVVLKVIKPHLAEAPGMVDQFVREASVSASLVHPNIVQVFDLGEESGMLYMVMEYVEGKDLAALIHRARKAKRVLSPEMVAYICVDVCKALECSHSHVDDEGRLKPIIHRDISPQNILISRAGQVKLADFGMARALGSSRHTVEGVVKGKLSYMSPEHSRADDVDARSDLFSFGVVIWEALTGRRLFLADSPLETIKRVRACEVPPLATMAPHVPAQLADLVHRMLSASPEDRYQNATDNRHALQMFLRSARSIDSAALAGLLEHYFPTETSRNTTAVPELSFADEGDVSCEGDECFEPTVEEEAPSDDQDEAVLSHTLVMFGERGEELAQAFKQAQAAAEEKRKRLQNESDAPTLAFTSEDVAKAAEGNTTAPTMPFDAEAVAEVHRQAEQQKAQQALPPSTLVVPPRVEAEPAGANPQPTPPPPSPAAIPPINPGPAQMPSSLAPAAPPVPASSTRPLLLSLAIGVPLGAVVGFVVFWLLTH